MRWLRQRDKYNCGPIALMNYDKWLGKKVTYKDLKRYSTRCGCTIEYGTWVRCISDLLGRSRKIGTTKLREHLKNIGPAIVVTQWKSGNWHYFFVSHRVGLDFACVNIYNKATVWNVPWRDMSRILKRGKCWLLKGK